MLMPLNLSKSDLPRQSKNLRPAKRSGSVAPSGAQRCDPLPLQTTKGTRWAARFPILKALFFSPILPQRLLVLAMKNLEYPYI